MRRRTNIFGTTRGVVAASAAGLLLGLAGCGGSESGSPAPAAPLEEPSPANEAATQVELRADGALRVEDSELLLIFENAEKGEEVTSFSNTGTQAFKIDASTAGGGAVMGATGPAGRSAVRLPAWSRNDPENAVVRVRGSGADDPLSPDLAPFTFGADFALDPESFGSSTDDGDNLIQRGLFDASSQYKIQIDRGRVSCRVAGLDGSLIVKLDEKVEPRAWYRVTCTRQGNSVSIDLLKLHGGDHEPATATERGPIGPVVMSGPTPLSVGGKLATDGSVLRSSTDQFNGAVDRVLFRLLR